MKLLISTLLAFAACAADVDVPAAPGSSVDDDGGVVASSEALTLKSVWFRPACSPSPAQRIYSELDGLEGFDGCLPVAVPAGLALQCATPTMNYDVMYRIYKQSPTTADAEVYHVDSIGSHAAYRIHCSCPDPVFGGGVGCISSPF